MVAGGYDALIQLWGQSVTDEVDGGNWLVKKEEAHRLPGQRHRDAKCATNRPELQVRYRVCAQCKFGGFFYKGLSWNNPGN